MEQERRRADRHELIYSLETFDTLSGRFMGYVADINTEGVMLLCEEELPLDEEFVMEIRLQDFHALMYYNDGRNKKLRFKARCQWNTKVKNAAELHIPPYRAGFKLMDINPGTLISITYMIRKFQKSHEV